MAEMNTAAIQAPGSRQGLVTSRPLPGTDFDLRHQCDIAVRNRAQAVADVLRKGFIK